MGSRSADATPAGTDDQLDFLRRAHEGMDGLERGPLDQAQVRLLRLLDLTDGPLSCALLKAATQYPEGAHALPTVCRRFRSVLLAAATAATVSLQRPALLRLCCKLRCLTLLRPRVPWEIGQSQDDGRPCCAPPTLAHLSALTRLDIEAEDLPPAEVAKLRCLPLLQHLGVRSLAESGEQDGCDGAMAPLVATASLRHLRLAPGMHRGAELCHVGALPALESLHLSECHALDLNSALAHITGLTTLTEFRVDDSSNISDAGLESLSHLTSLRSLDLGMCKVLTDDGFRHVSALQGLTMLNVWAVDCFTNEGAACLKNLTRLEALSIQGCDRITHEALVAVSALTTLTSLKFIRSRDEDADGIAAHVSGLVHLRELEFDQRGLTDRGMAALSQLTALTALDLSGCQRLTPAGLAQVSRFAALVRLDVSGMDFRPALPHLTALRQLGELKFQKDALPRAPEEDDPFAELMTDDVLAAVAALTSLTVLNLSSISSVTMAGIVHLRSLTALRELWLPYLGLPLDAALAQVSGLTALTELCLSAPFSDRRDLGDEVLAGLLPLTALQELCFEHMCNVSDAAIAALTRLRRLARLYFTGCTRLEDWGLLAKGGFPALKELYLEGCARLTDCGLARLRHSLGLERLVLRGCDVLTGSAFEGLRHLQALTEVRLRACPAVGARAVAALARFHHLQHLELNGCPGIADGMLALLLELPLESLGLADNPNVSAEGVETLSEMSRLRVLDLTRCPRVDDRCLPHLARMRELEGVTLRGTSVTERALAGYKELPYDV